jgi:hypothetical protein
MRRWTSPRSWACWSQTAKRRWRRAGPSRWDGTTRCGAGKGGRAAPRARGGGIYSARAVGAAAPRGHAPLAAGAAAAHRSRPRRGRHALLQVTFVEACIAAERLKAAAKAVRALGLEEEFPNVEVRRRGMRRRRAGEWEG